MGDRDFGTDLYVQKAVTPSQPISSIEAIRETVRAALGQNMIVDEGGQFSADNYFSATDSRHGLHFTIRGRAENVMVDIAMHLAQFQDPINLVLGKRITKNYKVTVTRHELMGGRVEQVPERAPARLVTSREVKSEVELVRYGNDVTIDTNLLASPEDFQADLKRKVDFQKNQFQQKLIELGYECLMNESQNLIHALARAIPAATPAQAREEANRRYFKDCFLAFNFPDARDPSNPMNQKRWDPTNVVGKILAHVRAAATATAAPMSVMLVPAGLDMQGYQREAAATFNVTGIRQDQIAPVQFPLPSVMVDPITNLRIGVHYPLLSYDRGSRNPMAQGNTGLTQTVYAMIRNAPNPPGNERTTLTTIEGPEIDQWTEFLNNPNSTQNDYETLMAPDNYRVVKMICSSAIVAAPGPDTGEMLVAYPQTTAHSIEVAPEEMKMQMRAYLGAAIYNDANVIRVPHVHCENAQIIDMAQFTREVPTIEQFFELFGNGQFLVLNKGQMTLALQRMDMIDSFARRANGGLRVEAGATEEGRGQFNPGVSTRGEFVDLDGNGDTDKSKSATDEGGAAVVREMPDSSAEPAPAGTKKKKGLPKGAHRA